MYSTRKYIHLHYSKWNLLFEISIVNNCRHLKNTNANVALTRNPQHTSITYEKTLWSPVYCLWNCVVVIYFPELIDVLNVSFPVSYVKIINVFVVL